MKFALASPRQDELVEAGLEDFDLAKGRDGVLGYVRCEPAIVCVAVVGADFGQKDDALDCVLVILGESAEFVEDIFDGEEAFHGAKVQGIERFVVLKVQTILAGLTKINPLGAWLGVAASHAWALPHLCVVSSCAYVFCAAEILKALANEDALECVSADAKSLCSGRVTDPVVVLA